MDLNNIYGGADTFTSRNEIFRDYERFPYGSFRASKHAIKEPLFYTLSQSENAIDYDSRVCRNCGRQIKIKPTQQIATISQKVFEADDDDSCYGHQANGEFGYVNQVFVNDENDIENIETKF